MPESRAYYHDLRDACADGRLPTLQRGRPQRRELYQRDCCGRR